MLKSILIYLTHPYVQAWNFDQTHLKTLQAAIPGFTATVCYKSRDFLKLLPEAEAVLVWYFKKEWLETAPKLKLIATPAAGKDWIDVEPGKGIELRFGRFHGAIISETVLGAMLYFCRAFGPAIRMQKKRRWAPIKISNEMTSLDNSRVLILGFGNIGQAIARKLKPFRCRITGLKRRMVPTPDYFEEGDRVILPDQLEDNLPEADHLIFALPGGEETDGIFTRDHFRLLKKSCFIYNVGRGRVFSERDVVEALEEEWIRGAYLDVFETEPLSETSRLWDFENVLIQPHLSAAAPQYLELFLKEWFS